MFPINKSLRVFLPLATAATATIITTYLIISIGADKDKNKEEDPALENIELKSKEFEEEIIQNDQESEKDEKSDSEPKEKEKGKDVLDKEKPKEEPISAEDATKILEQAENAAKQLASQGGDGRKEKNLKIEGKAQISSSEEEERVQNQEEGSEQTSSLPKVKGTEEAPKTEESSTQELKEGKEETSLRADEDSRQEDDPEHEGEENQITDTQDAGAKELQEEPNPDGAEGDVQATPRDPSGSDSQLDGEDSQTVQEFKSENEKPSAGDEGDSEEGAYEITPETVEKLVALRGEMSDYKDKIQALLRSIA